jgi:hypothetical protein
VAGRGDRALIPCIIIITTITITIIILAVISHFDQHWSEHAQPFV